MTRSWKKDENPKNVEFASVDESVTLFSEKGQSTAEDENITFNQKKAEETAKDKVATFYMKVKEGKCFNAVLTYVVELPLKEHKRPEVMEAKQKEIENLKHYNTFEEVNDENQERITMRWVITQKEKHDGQKESFKARLVARGFQENTKP